MAIIEIQAISLVILIAFCIFVGLVLAEMANEDDGYDGPPSHSHIYLPAKENKWLGEDENVMLQVEYVCIVCGETKLGDAKKKEDVEGEEE